MQSDNMRDAENAVAVTCWLIVCVGLAVIVYIAGMWPVWQYEWHERNLHSEPRSTKGTT